MAGPTLGTYCLPAGGQRCGFITSSGFEQAAGKVGESDFLILTQGWAMPDATNPGFTTLKQEYTMTTLSPQLNTSYLFDARGIAKRFRHAAILAHSNHCTMAK
jgi:hypothetical protein